MSAIFIGVIGVLCFLVLALLGAPIATSMAIIGFVGFSFLSSVNAASAMVTQEIVTTFTSYTFSVLPMFAFMGFLAFHSGIGSRLYNFAYKVIGHLPGGLAIATQASCAVFGAICGSSIATVATIGAVAMPEMRKYKYSDSLSTASIAAAGNLGILIPPSMIFIVYSLATGQSIGKLFLAGIIPGILLMVLFMITVFVCVSRNPDIGPPGPRGTYGEKIRATAGGIWEVFIIVCFSVGGLVAGWFTPTEAGAIGSTGILLVIFLGRRLNWGIVKAALLDTTKMTAMTMLLITGAIIMGRFISVTRLPFEMATFASELLLPPVMIMVIILAVYIILGFFLDVLALVLLTIPVFYPVVITLGYDPIWFGVIVVLVVAMGSITPPIGMAVYVMKGVAPEVPLDVIFHGIWPFLIAMIICTIILIAFPSIATFLPNLFI